MENQRRKKRKERLRDYDVRPDGVGSIKRRIHPNDPNDSEINETK